MRRPRPRAAWFAPVVAGLVVVAVTAACSSSGGGSQSSASSRPTSTAALSFKPCGQVACEGELNGAKYQILMPATWNGTLLLYSHGYRFAHPVPPDYATPATNAIPAPGEAVAATLLSQGYALAGSSFATNGWAVPDGVRADQELYDFFAGSIGKPRRVYVWGDSLGGLITQTLAEKGLPWVTGAAPLCGVLGGANENLDLALDVEFAVKTLLAPKLKLTGFTSARDAADQWTYATQAITAATKDIKNGVPRIALVAALVDAPRQTAHFDGSTPAKQVGAAVESALSALAYGTSGRYEVEQRVDGNPSGNSGVDYATRISTLERGAIDTFGGAGATDKLLTELAAAPRVAAQPAARQEAAQTLGEPTGGLEVPTVTMHTTGDQLVIAQNETLFRRRVVARGAGEQLTQLYVAPPTTYSAVPPFGAGHCAFSDAQRVGVISLLDTWVRTGQAPTAASSRTAIPDGLAPDAYSPGPWPALT